MEIPESPGESYRWLSDGELIRIEDEYPIILDYKLVWRPTNDDGNRQYGDFPRRRRKLEKGLFTDGF